MSVKVTTDEAQIPSEVLADIAWRKAKGSLAEVRDIRKGSRTVNGTTVFFIEFTATVDSLPMRYYGHYFGNEKGNVQILAWTHLALFDRHVRAIDEFVSGLEVK